MRVLVSLIAAMSFVLLVTFAVAVSHDGRSPQEIGVSAAVEAAVPSEVACLTCGHDGYRDQYIRTNCIAIANIATVAKVYSLKLPLVSLMENDNLEADTSETTSTASTASTTGNGHKQGRTLVVS